MSKTNVPLIDALWFVECIGNEQGWDPLWKIDSDKLELLYEANQTQTILVYNTHYTADIQARIITPNYAYDTKPRRIIRGTWFWFNATQKKYLPFEEDVATRIGGWFNDVKLSVRTFGKGAFRSELQLDHVFGYEHGKIKVIANKTADVESSDVRFELSRNAGKGEGTRTPVPVATALLSHDVTTAYPVAEEASFDGNNAHQLPTNLPTPIASQAPSWFTGWGSAATRGASATSVSGTAEVTIAKPRKVEPLAEDDVGGSNVQLEFTRSADYFPVGYPIRCGYEWRPSEEEMQANYAAGHLALVVHGIGEALWSRNDNALPSFRESVARLRLLCLQQRVESYDAQCKASPDRCFTPVTRVEFLPVEWFGCVHSDELDISKQINNVTIRNIPMIRDLANDAILDVLLYLTPEFKHRINREVMRKLNAVYRDFCANNPDFRGGVSLVGHSLGTVIAFDLLSSQPLPQKPPLPSDVRDEQDALVFVLDAFYALGSPLGLFLSLRNQGRGLSKELQLPTCPKVFNVFHPFDPVAYRVEPLFDSAFADKETAVVPHCGSGGYTLKYQFQRFASSLSTLTTDISSLASKWPLPLFSRRSQPGTDDPGGGPDPGRRDGSAELPGVLLNGEDRIDWCLQETALANTSPYLAALTSHIGYFESKDVAKFFAVHMDDQVV